MIRNDLGVYLTVISHARTANIKRMHDLVGDATWFVGEDEASAYDDAARAADVRIGVIESGALCRSRNAALRKAWSHGLPCVELSDDLTKVQVAMWDAAKAKIVARDALFHDALRRVLEGMEQTGAKLGGCAPTANPFYANVEKPVHPSAFIVGDMIVVQPCEVFFDETMTLKEDYDYTLQHLMTHGCVARRDDVLLTFLHRKNAGGAVEARTPELEQKNIAHLKAKWPQFIRDNPRRPDEILLKLPRAPRAGAVHA